jgi:hypothetical protein
VTKKQRKARFLVEVELEPGETVVELREKLRLLLSLIRDLRERVKRLENAQTREENWLT